ncbi:MAG TPA: hypothetical protein H9770_01600 [Candidatus Fournierella excrementigallinarum]|nr:hypothetical protein [Candidatus Fournierella excrementigallinarum]
MNHTDLKGRLMLKVVGILYIIFAALSILTGLLAVVGGAALGVAGGESLALGLGVVAMVFGLMMILSSVFSLVAGILGVKWCNRPDKAGTLFVLGVVLTALAVLNLLSSFGGDNGSAAVVGALIGLVLPVLYTLGAWQNKQSLQ